MNYAITTQPDGSQIRYTVAERWIVDGTTNPRYWPMGLLDELMRAWERSPFPPEDGGLVMTDAGLEHARQQLLKERLRSRRVRK